jgi:inorganic triphosphatase YgiF
MSHDRTSLERELKLRPAEPALLDRLAALDHLGPFVVTGRRREQQRNSFFDTRSRAFEAARLGFRRRVIDGRALATWTLKAEGRTVHGVAERPEIELQLDPELPPALVIGTLRQAARQRGAAVLAETLGDVLATDGLPLARPVLETETQRVVLDLELPERGGRAELALDGVQLVGHSYREAEIEVELRRGGEDVLQTARHAIQALGVVSESDGSKLSRALAHLRACTCPIAVS